MVMTSSRKRHLEYNHKQDTDQNQHTNVNTSRNSIEIRSFCHWLRNHLLTFFLCFLANYLFHCAGEAVPVRLCVLSLRDFSRIVLQVSHRPLQLMDEWRFFY